MGLVALVLVGCGGGPGRGVSPVPDSAPVRVDAPAAASFSGEGPGVASVPVSGSIAERVWGMAVVLAEELGPRASATG